jgi:hypothetical protein
VGVTHRFDCANDSVPEECSFNVVLRVDPAFYASIYTFAFHWYARTTNH